MIRLTEEEQNAVSVYALGRAAGRFTAAAADVITPCGHDGYVASVTYRRPVWVTSFALLMRPYEEDGSCDLILAAARRTGEATGAALWRIGARSFAAESRLDYHYGAMSWSWTWSRRPDRLAGGGWSHDVQRETGAPLLPWAPLVNAPACEGTPWEYIARAAARVEPKSAPVLLATWMRWPQVELLARAGLGEQWWRQTVLWLLERSARHRAWVAAHAAELAADNIGPRDALPVAGRGGTVEEARRAAYYRTMWHGCALHGVDRAEAAAYCEARGVTRAEYSDYLALAVAAGLDPRSRSVAFPRGGVAALADRLRKEADARSEEHTSEDMRRAVAAARAAFDGVRWPEGWCVSVLASQDAMVREGSAMGNCIGNGRYARAQAAGQCVCIVIEGPRRIRCDAELRGGRVAQCYRRGNLPPPDEARAIARRAAAALRRAAS